MDRLTSALPPASAAARSAPQLPPEAPLAMPPQTLEQRFRDPEAPGVRADRRTRLARWFVLGGGFAIAMGLSLEMLDILAVRGLSTIEVIIALLFLVNIAPIALAATNAILGVGVLSRPDLFQPPSPEDGASDHGLDVALLMPIYNETPQRLFAGAVTMLDGVIRPPAAARRGSGSGHRFTLYILSDTTDPQIAAEEAALFEQVRAQAHPETAARMFYRRRHDNVNRKAGNIADWVTRWGGRHEAMIVLDADSVMAPDTLRTLSSALAADPSAGLIQTVPRLVDGHTLFARLQQFANTTYGPVAAAGLAAWYGPDGNYWGHNAIIRCSAFAATAGLPDLPGRPPLGGAILSHDFVEAALMRRAGWGVRMLIPDPEGQDAQAQSYEETPPTLVDHVLRDRRWCQGNLQHGRLINASGLHPLSRFHLLQGVLAYLSAPLWFAFLIAGFTASFIAAGAPVDYFAQPYALFPTWPIIDDARALRLFGLVATVLFLPKLLSIALLCLRRSHRVNPWGSRVKLIGSGLVDTVLSALLAPVFMIQHSFAVLHILAGSDGGWKPQRRDGSLPNPLSLLWFHRWETAFGALLCAMVAFGPLTAWVLPVAVGLVLAVPLSWLTAVNVAVPFDRLGLLLTPERMRIPTVLLAVDATERRIKAHAMETGAAQPERPQPETADISRIPEDTDPLAEMLQQRQPSLVASS